MEKSEAVKWSNTNNMLIQYQLSNHTLGVIGFSRPIHPIYKGIELSLRTTRTIPPLPGTALFPWQLSCMKPWKKDLRWGFHYQLFEDIKWRRPSRLLHHLHTPSCRVCMSRLSYRSTAISLRSIRPPAEVSTIRIISTHDLSYRHSLEVFNIPIPCMRGERGNR